MDYEFITVDDVHRIHENKATHWIALRYKVLVNPKQVINGKPDKFDEIK